MQEEIEKSPKISSNYQLFTSSEEDMQILCKQMLKTRIFRGEFQEKRYVDSLNVYRDLIVVKGTKELDFCDDLLAVRKRVMRFYKNNIWPGFESHETNGLQYIWILTDLKKHIPFGEYWFQVKSIYFKKTEISLKLKVLREFKLHEMSTSNTFPDSNITDSISGEKIAQNFLEYFTTFNRELYTTVLGFCSVNLTAENTLFTIKYMAILISAFITGLFVSIKYIGFFILNFMDKFSGLIYAFTPIILRLIDLLCKIIGGLFVLLAMIWRDCIGSRLSSNNNRQTRETFHRSAIAYEPQTRQPSSFSHQFSRF